MPSKNQPITQLKVAIIGAGPAGLGAGIEFAKLPFVKWNLYEQATSIREIGAGISIQRNTWRLLDVMGASRNFKPGDFYRPVDNHSVQHRNGRTEELLDSHAQHDTPENHLHARTHRAKLQNALLKEVDQTRIRLSSRLTKVERQASGKLSLEFQDGFKDVVDLLVGADGVRSVARNFAFPDHRISYTGRTAYRTIVSTEEISTIPEVPNAVTFWHGPNSWLYTCSLGDNKFEITTMTREPEEKAKKVSWGQDASKEEMIRHFKEFAPVAQKVLALPREVKQYALFAGPRLESVVAHGSVALVGDASHPLSGAFGAGAGFALEDVYVLTQSISWAHQRKLTLQEGLNLFDKIRGPHYKHLYSILDEFAVTVKHLEDAELGFDESVKMIVERNWNSRYKWLVDYDVQQVVKDTIEQEDSLRSVARENPRL